MDNPIGNNPDPWFAYTASLVYRAWQLRDSDPSASIAHASNIESWDWRAACVDWHNRRASKVRQKLKEKQA